MRAGLRLLLAVLVLVTGTVVARAGYDESQAWFNALPLEQRSEIQSQLILLGYYEYLVDGAFGQGTFSGLTAFQRSLSRAVTGVLSESDLTRLKTTSDAVASRLGLKQIEDSAGRISIVVPEALLTQSSDTGRGTAYMSEDGGFALETSHIPHPDKDFAALYAEFAAEGPGRIVSYASYNPDRFVVSGTDSGRRFYLMYRNAQTESVGYEVTWTQPYHRDAAIVSTYLASYAEPLRFALETADQATLSNITALRRYGAFTLPETRPYAIQLNDEIGHATARDFEKALAARPDASVLILNSPGGYVDTALVIANTVRQRGMTTVVPRGSGCYSACAYIFFAGLPRQVDGELGVHQIYAEVADLVYAQTTLSDILDALDQYGVQQIIVSHMLRTPPEDMYVFSRTEVIEWDINQGGPIQLAEVGPEAPDAVEVAELPVTDGPATDGGGVYVHLAQFSSRTEAERSLETARNRWSSVLGQNAPVIQPITKAGKQSFRISVPARSLENANAICAAIKSSGGGCYVTAG